MAQVATATTPQPARSPGRSGANARSRRRLGVFRIGVFIAACLFTIPGTLTLLIIPMDSEATKQIKASSDH